MKPLARFALDRWAKPDGEEELWRSLNPQPTYQGLSPVFLRKIRGFQESDTFLCTYAMLVRDNLAPHCGHANIVPMMRFPHLEQLFSGG